MVNDTLDQSENENPLSKKWRRTESNKNKDSKILYYTQNTCHTAKTSRFIDHQL